MSEKDLSELVAELRAAIADSSGLSDDDRSHLDALAGRIEAETDDDSIAEQVDEAVTRFGVEHVGLARVINRIADTLAAGGL